MFASDSSWKLWKKRMFRQHVGKKDVGNVIRVPSTRTSHFCLRVFRLILVHRQQRTQSSGKATPLAAAADAPPRRAPLSGTNDPSGKNDGAEHFRNTNQSSSAKPISSPQRPYGSGKGINDIEDLSLEQATSDEAKVQSTFANNPRKRGAEAGTGSSNPQAHGQYRQFMSTTPKHGRTSSGGKHVEALRHKSPSEDPEYKRGHSGPKQSLWDPNLDPTKNPKGGRRKLQHVRLDQKDRPKSQAKEFTVTNINPRGWYDQAHNEQPRVSHHFGGSSRQEKVPSISGNDHDSHSIGSPPEVDTRDNGTPEEAETDIEMLLQPETRPISHEQLVVEVKGIYAGLVMVEAKCIDIDERQAAAAQENDPTKQTDLKHDQWQSLIALHKQVFCVVLCHPATELSLIQTS